MLLILTILFLMGELVSLKKLLKPTSVVKQTRKADMEKMQNEMSKKNDKDYESFYIGFLKIFMTILMICYSLFFYLANSHINNFIFSLISALLAAYIIVDALTYMKQLNDIPYMISKRCSTKSIMIDRITTIIDFSYGLFIMFYLFFGNVLFK
jgi:phosphatidylglycerophosphate synthase